MKRILDVIAPVLVTALALKFFFDMIKPYVGWIVLAVVLMMVCGRLRNRFRAW